jgi:polyferredoxin
VISRELAKDRARVFLDADGGTVECPDCGCCVDGADDRNIALFIRHNCQAYGTTVKNRDNKRYDPTSKSADLIRFQYRGT